MAVGDRWSSRLGFILATIGSAVGLGNIWRFPYRVGVNGGGAFLLPYLVSILLFALPILIFELGSGHRFRGGVYGTFKAIRPWARWAGVFLALSTLVLLSYYLVIAGWAFGYFVNAVSGNLPRFSEFTDGYNSVMYFMVLMAFTGGIVLLGVKKGIENSSRVLIPLLFLSLVGLAAYGLFLPGWRDGIRFYLTPDLGALGDPLVWSTAFGQAFFSVGVGGGIMITYGAYVSGKENIAGSSRIVVSADVLAAFVAGLVIFPIVFSYGGEPASGPKLAFDNLPLVFSRFPGIVGYMLAALFYLLLTIAALTSSISLLETVLLAAVESTGIKRRYGVMVLLALLVLLGLPSALSYSGGSLSIGGKPFLDWADDLVGTWLLPLGVLITAVVLGWLAPAREMMQEVKQGFWGWLVLMLVRFAVPLAIIVVLVTTVLKG